MSLVAAHLNGTMTNQIEMVDLNLPPGTLTKAALKQGLGEEVHEEELLRKVTEKLREKQTETVKRLKNKWKLQSFVVWCALYVSVVYFIICVV